MIFETLVTTRNADGTTNLAPMGAGCADGDLARSFELRPFCESRTFENLVPRPFGVLHVSDDVLLFAQAALDRLPANLPFLPANRVDCERLGNAARIYEFEVAWLDAHPPRPVIQCRTVATQTPGDIGPFNRARHLVLEATILATRMHLVPVEVIRERCAVWAPVIEKTGGAREKAAWELLVSVFGDADRATGDEQSGAPAVSPWSGRPRR